MYRLPVWGGCGAQVICYGTIPRDLCRAVSPEARTGNRIISGNDKREGVGMLTADPPVPYIEIGARLGIPVGSIGPTRRRCLDKIRRHPAITALINAEAQTGRRDAGPGPVRPQR